MSSRTEQRKVIRRMKKTFWIAWDEDGDCQAFDHRPKLGSCGCCWINGKTPVSARPLLAVSDIVSICALNGLHSGRLIRVTLNTETGEAVGRVVRKGKK